MKNLAKVAIILTLIFISCNSKQKYRTKKSSNEIVGLFTAIDATSDKMADSLRCEGIKYELKINSDTSYSFISRCPANTRKIFSTESGKWKLVNDSTLKLISKSSGQWIIKIEQNKNFLTFLKKDEMKLNYQYRLTRDTTQD